MFEGVDDGQNYSVSGPDAAKGTGKNLKMDKRTDDDTDDDENHGYLPGISIDNGREGTVVADADAVFLVHRGGDLRRHHRLEPPAAETASGSPPLAASTIWTVTASSSKPRTRRSVGAKSAGNSSTTSSATP